MAARKSLNLLPGIFQTDANQKFLSATVDQLISEPNLTKINGYIGRQFAPTYKSGDSYITETTKDRQNYQLEPSILIRDDRGDITFFATYNDFLNKLKYYGAITTDHSRLFNNEHYSYDPGISYDKFVNFSQYYWLPDGPDVVDVNAAGIDISIDYTVVRNTSTGRYDFVNGNEINNTIVLARGGKYTFTVDQPGVPFWIQSELGLDGLNNATPTISTRDVLGVENNGTDAGTITFQVPPRDAQDRFAAMTTVANVDYATPIAYADLHNSMLSVFLANFPQYAGIVGQLNGKTVIFVDEYLHTSRGEEAWTAKGVYDLNGYQIDSYDEGNVVPDTDRYGIWKVVYVDSGIPNDPIIRATPVQAVNQDEKVFIKYGVANANKEFYKEFTGFFKRMPVLTSLQDTLYYQDGTLTSLYGSIKIVDPTNLIIDVDNDIIGKPTYTSPNGIKFTSGLKIGFGSDVTPAKYQNKQYYVENVGEAIRLVDIDWLVTPELYNDELATNYPDQVFPEYITIKRDAVDVNAWSRNNRWFHRNVITITASYNNTQPVFDQTLRAQRPIVQFEGDFQLFNNGRIGKQPIDVLDVTTLDPFNSVEGQVLTAAFGVPLYNGLRVLFGAATDPLVRDKIYTVNLVQYDADPVTGVPAGEFHVKLTIADDGDSQVWDTVVVTSGQYKGSQWWYDGTQWLESQQKTELQQDPLYNVYNTNGTSIGDYTRSTFEGTRLFGYVRKTTGTADSVLGFPLSYRNFGTQGDIEFKNYFDTDTFTYVTNQTVLPDLNIAEYGFIQKIIDRNTVGYRNVWKTVSEDTKQYQIISYTYTSGLNPYILDVVPADSASIPYIKVYKNNTYVNSTLWTLVDKTLTLTTTLAEGDKIDVLIYSKTPSDLGYYEIPDNLNLNAQNIDLDTLTLGQIRNHLVELSQNSTEVEGNVLGANNLRDIEIKQQGGTILQHSATLPYGAIFLLDDTANFINALRFAQLEYSKFKNKFLELSATLPGIDPTDPVSSVDTILSNINAIKNKSFPWFYSDMVPYGTLKNTINYTIFDPLVRSYEISNVFNDQALSNLAVLVYLNNVQLIKDKDYIFETTRPAITLLDSVTVAVDDVITFVEYQNTDGNYIPETPTKLGLYPKYIPTMFVDDTYRTSTTVIRGHDGSITPSFDDYRDEFLLELEKRIFNNIKVDQTAIYNELVAVMPGKFRDNDYTIREIKQLLSKNFQAWAGNNKLDFATNSTFESNDGFTWNYSGAIDRIDSELLPGSWRACYLYFYDTIRPHLMPWEMLGFSVKPDWWEDYYGPAPYTGGNKLLWDDLEAGRIRYGDRAGINLNYARPGLSKIIPVDQNGFLLSPAAILAIATNPKSSANSWAVGDIGPTEWAWRSSSDFPFAIQQALALAKPARYFSLLQDTYRYKYNTALGQYLSEKNHHIRQSEIRFNGEVYNNTLTRTAGYINWIADYLTNQGIDPVTKITPMLTNYEVDLAYKVSGFTDQRYIKVLAEQSSPSSTNDSILIPDENYEVFLYKSTPVQRLVYSAVIVEKTTNGYSVRGYDLNNPFFTIIPSVINSNAYSISVLNVRGVIYKDYQNLKLTVPYGYEFTTSQQIVDFLVSYERFLVSQGFAFNDMDEMLGETHNFKLSAKEFLFWIQQGWKPGSILVLSPVLNNLTAISNGAVTDGITDSQYGSKVVDQNFKLIKNNNYNVVRDAENFKLTITDNTSVIGFAEVNLVQYEHVLIFDNTTVFNDIIYKPELGNRQYRLKLIGQKTGDWNGSLYAPGFIYNSSTIKVWAQGKDYLKGDLVEYKNQYYVALQNITATVDFDFTYWKQINDSEIKTGLLPNFSTIASKSQSNYDSYGYFQDEEQLKYSHGLIGFKPRQYLNDLGMNETTQIELYKGFIKQKGSANAINQLTKAEFNNLNSDISYFEEWAIRVGEYGALDINPYVEIALDEKAFGVNPAIAKFVGNENNNDGDGITIFNKAQLYKSTDQFSGNIAINRTDSSNYDNDIPTVGYVNIDDVDVTIYDLANFVELNTNLANITTGYTIWCAKDFARDWNVYRVSETNNHVTKFSNSLDNYVTITTDLPHGLAEDDVFLVKNLDARYDGFYQVYRVVDINNILVVFNGSTSDYEDLKVFNGNGLLLKLHSVRFTYMEDSRVFGLSNPLHKWKEGDRIWIDVDAETTAVQGQPYSPTKTWKVYEKAYPWELKQDLQKGTSEYVANDGFGSSARMSDNGLLAVVGSPNSSVTGTVVTYDKNEDDEFIQGFTLAPDATDTSEFGFAVDLAVETVGVGAPGSYSDVGYVYVYSRPTATTTFNRSQVIVGNTSATGRFGHSISFDEYGRWLYVGAPDEDRVYVYGLNTSVPEELGIVAVNNENILKLTGDISSLASVGDTLTQMLTGANVEIIAIDGPNSNVTVSSLTNIIAGVDGANIGNVYISRAFPSSTVTDTTFTVQTIYTRSVTDSITLPFTPAVTDDADSLLVTSTNRTFIPNIDYTVSGDVVTFTAGNIAQGQYVVEQKPYYALTTVIEGPAGSEFGYALDASLDGAQLGVGTPNDTVVVDGESITGAGSVYVYDRVIEAFESTGEQDYVTTGTIGAVHRVTIDNVEVNDYYVIGSNTIRFILPPAVGKVIYVETNVFNLLEKLIGIDSLAGGLTAIQKDARFGSALTICSNNCAIYVGAPNFDNGSVYNTGAVWKFHNRGRLYGTNTGYVKNPTFTPGDTFRLDNFEITVSTPDVGQSSLDSLIEDINSAGILGVSAVNENGYLRLNSDKTVAKNLLRILSGSGTVWADAGLIVFAFMQIIVPPFNNTGEHFGNKVILARNAYMLVISSDRGTTRSYATFDAHTSYMHPSTPAYVVVDGVVTGTDATHYLLDSTSAETKLATTFDDGFTSFFDSISGSGSVYIYELYDDPRDAVENPGRYSYCQQLNTGDLNTGDQFGYAIDIVGNQILVTAPSDDTTLTDAGTVYLFKNPQSTRGWKLIRWQQDKVDIDSINRLYLYNKLTNTILTNLEFIDPAKGKILGSAEQDITYKTAYDPAYYNRGTGVEYNISDNLYWTLEHVGEVWWNLDQVRYIDYEQSTTTYRSINWGNMFPGSTIEVCEWVESDVPPAQYTVSDETGSPKYTNGPYVELTFVDPVTNIITSKYYFWVKNKSSVNPNDPKRNIPITSIQSLIENPKAQGIPYAAIIQSNAIVVYNIGNYLSAQDIILHVDYELLRNDSIIHSEYELLQAKNLNSYIPNKISAKLIDSLSGIDPTGSTVPDPILSVADSLGVGFRPRQSMFIDRLKALGDLVDYVNRVLITKPIARQYNLAQLRLQEDEPNFKLGEYDIRIDTEVDLAYIDTTNLSAGYNVLVTQDTTQDNLWVLYTLTSNKAWVISRVQSYKTDLYWEYVDWYATGFDENEKVEYVVDTLVEALKLPVTTGDEILVRVSNSADGGWNLLTVLPNGEYSVVGIQNGTIQLKPSLSDFANTELGFGNQGFSSNRYDQNPNIEIRNIVNALKDDIFVDELQGEFNKLFFVMVNYIFNEQKYVDWIFKTSFISVTHQLRALDQYPNYVKDNQTYYLDYINEVKPYATKVREYLINYNGSDTFEGSVTDFDLPAYYDSDTKMFRSPSGEQVAKDSQLWATGYLNETLINQDYVQWYENRNHKISSILLETPGSGYTTEPIVTIVGKGGNIVPATARAIIDFDTGTVTSIELLTSGSGYSDTPTVIINGSCDTPATAYAVLYNNQVRTFDTTLKFDRITDLTYGINGTIVQEWTANTLFAANTIVSYDGVGYRVLSTFTTGSTFISNDYEVVRASDFNNANDRIMAYYNPTNAMPAKDLRQLLKGIEYPGVQVTGLGFNQQPGFSGSATIELSANAAVAVSAGDVIGQYNSNAAITVTESSSGSVITGVLITNDDFRTDGTVLQLNSANIAATATSVTYVSSATPNAFDDMAFDDIEYDEDGNPVIGLADVDTNIISSYLDTQLGLRPEDINVDGGAYVDTYSSHAPEELVPGRIFDTLDMKIYTNVSGGVLGYRMFVNMFEETSFLRIADAFTTTLAQELNYTDTEIVVNDVSVLSVPNPSARLPGVVFIGTERITYYTVDTMTNTLGQIRRGTQGTSCPAKHLAGTQAIDGGLDQIIPGVALGNTTISSDTTYSVTNTVPYKLTVSEAISANIGDIILQTSTGANVTVLSANNSSITTLLVKYNSSADFALGNITLGNISVGGTFLDNVYPVSSTIAGYGLNETGTVEIAEQHLVSGTTGNILAKLHGDSIGNVLTTTNINMWYNDGVTTATDGSGFEGSTTSAVEFLKEYTATNTLGASIPDALTTEDAINTLTTENGNQIFEE